MSAEFVHLASQFYTTEIKLMSPNRCNDCANYSLSYVQYFIGKRTVQFQNEKIEILDPKKVEDSYPWIPPAIKATAYFLLAIPFTIIGTIARFLSLHSKEVSAAVFFAGRVDLPPPKKTEEPSSPANPEKPPELKAEDPPVERLDQLKNIIKSMSNSAEYKRKKQEEMTQMLAELTVFEEKILELSKKSDKPLAAIQAYIEEKKMDSLFFTRNYFIFSTPTLEMMGINLEFKDLDRWGVVDEKFEILMHTYPELTQYLYEEPSSQVKQHLAPMLSQMNASMPSAFELIKPKMVKFIQYFEKLLALMQKKPVELLAIAALLQQGDEPLACTKVIKAQQYFLKQFFKESKDPSNEQLYDKLIEIYIACILLLPKLNTPNLSCSPAENPSPIDARSSLPPSLTDQLKKDTAFFSELIQLSDNEVGAWLEEHNIENMYPFIRAKSLSDPDQFKKLRTEVKIEIVRQWKNLYDTCKEKFGNTPFRRYLHLDDPQETS